MKTFLSIVRPFYIVGFLTVFGTIGAQTIISFDASPDNTMVMKIQNPKLSDKPDKLILIFDSTILTCEFSENGLIALHTTEYKNGNSALTSSHSYIFSTKCVKNENLLKEIKENKNPYNEVETEEPISLEDWMLCPDKWKENNNF